MARPKILIVDDNEEARFILKSLLWQKGPYEFLEATNGQEALAVAYQNLPDLILMDLMMPVLDGWEATRRIRALESSVRTVPIIAVTAAYDMDNITERALAAGCNDCLAKPIVPRALLFEKVEHYLAQRQVQPSQAVSP